MTVWYESALLPPVAGAQRPLVEVNLPESPRRYTQPYSPPSHGASARYLGGERKSPRRQHVSQSAGSPPDGADQPWWWPGAQGGSSSSARGSGEAAGSLAARLTKERLGAVHGGHGQAVAYSSPAQMLARTMEADLLPPAEPPPPPVHHGGPIYCNPSQAAKDLEGVRPMKRDAPPMQFAYLAEAVAASAAASHDTTGLTKIGMGEMLMKRKVKRRKMQKGKHSAVWESCGSPKVVADGEGLDLKDQRQAIAISTARSGEVLVAIPGMAHEQAAEAEDEPEDDAAGGDLGAVLAEAARLEREASAADAAANTELADAQAAEAAATDALYEAKATLEQAKTTEAEAEDEANAATGAAAEWTRAQMAAVSTEAAALQVEQQAVKDMAAQQ